jgi:hypothetical protein
VAPSPSFWGRFGGGCNTQWSVKIDKILTATQKKARKLGQEVLQPWPQQPGYCWLTQRVSQATTSCDAMCGAALRLSLPRSCSLSLAPIHNPAQDWRASLYAKYRDTYGVDPRLLSHATPDHSRSPPPPSPSPRGGDGGVVARRQLEQQLGEPNGCLNDALCSPLTRHSASIKQPFGAGLLDGGGRLSALQPGQQLRALFDAPVRARSSSELPG